jgi:hypothetical protein
MVRIRQIMLHVCNNERSEAMAIFSEEERRELIALAEEVPDDCAVRVLIGKLLGTDVEDFTYAVIELVRNAVDDYCDERDGILIRQEDW